MHRVLSLLVLLVVLSFATPSHAVSVVALQFLEDPYTHAILHAAPARDPESTRNSRRDECSAREDLTGPGRLMAAAVGRAIQKAGVRIDVILSSPRCDAAMTARLLELVPSTKVDFLAPEPPAGATAEDQRDDALVFLAGQRPLETALFVTHGRNIAALTGVETTPGQLLIVEVSPAGVLEVLYTIDP